MKISKHLTWDQKTEIRNRALEMAYEDSQQNADYLYSIVQQWVDSFDTKAHLNIITSDEDMIREIIDFNPSTGKPWVDE